MHRLPGAVRVGIGLTFFSLLIAVAPLVLPFATTPPAKRAISVKQERASVAYGEANIPIATVRKYLVRQGRSNGVAGNVARDEPSARKNAISCFFSPSLSVECPWLGCSTRRRGKTPSDRSRSSARATISRRLRCTGRTASSKPPSAPKSEVRTTNAHPLIQSSCRAVVTPNAVPALPPIWCPSSAGSNTVHRAASDEGRRHVDSLFVHPRGHGCHPVRAQQRRRCLGTPATASLLSKRPDWHRRRIRRFRQAAHRENRMRSKIRNGIVGRPVVNDIDLHRNCLSERRLNCSLEQRTRRCNSR